MVSLGLVFSISFGAATAADVHSTMRMRAPEANPIVRPFHSSPAPMILTNTGAAVSTVVLSDWLRKKGHPKWANGILLGGTVARGGAAIKNYSRMRE